MDENLKEILNELKSINTKIDSISDGQKRLEEGQKSLEKRQEKLEIKQSKLEKLQNSTLDYLYQLEAKNEERHLYMTKDIEQLKKDVKYLKHREQQTDNDIVTIKSKLDII